MKKLLIAVAMTLSSLVIAQDTTSCEPLLEAARPTTEQQRILSDVHTMEMRLTSRQIVDGEPVTLETHSVFDFVDERMYQATALDGEPTMTVRYSGGDATMTIPGMGMSMPAPPVLERQLEDQLEQILEGGLADPTRFAGEAELVRCDGEQRYGDVLAGEQVTVRIEGGSALTQELRPDAPVRLVFRGGRLEGMIQETPGADPLLMVFEEIVAGPEGLTERMTIRQYHWDGSEAEETGVTTIEYEFDRPIDEALFAP